MKKKVDYVFDEIIPTGQIPDSLNGITVLVFGGSGGIGENICESVNRAGAKTIVVGRNLQKLRMLSHKLPEVRIEECDVSDIRQIESLFYNKLTGSIPDVVINSVGILLDSDKARNLFAVTEDNWDNSFKINFTSNVIILRTYKKLLIENSTEGKFISISSIDGTRSAITPYGLSKACLNQYLSECAVNDKKLGIYIIAPGPTATKMMDESMNFSHYRKDHPDLRCAVPQDIGNLAVMLASKECRLKNGSLIKCDGGFTL